MPTIHSYIGLAIVLPVSVFGIFGNFMVIIAVRRYKDLRTKHGSLISFLCFYQSVGLLGEVTTSISNLFQEITDRSTCFYSLLPLSFIYNVQLLLMLTISLDLVFLTYRPTKYHTVHLFPYAILIQLPCFLLSSALSIASIPFIDRSTIVFCDIAEAYPKATAKLWNFSTILVGVGVLAIYALVMFEMWLRDLKNVRKSEGVCKLDPSMRYQRKMIRTVSVMTTAFLCTGFASSLLVLATDVIPCLQRIYAPYIKFYTMKIGLLSCAQNFYIYFTMSKDYQKAFKKILQGWRKWKFDRFKNSTQAFTITNGH